MRPALTLQCKDRSDLGCMISAKCVGRQIGTPMTQMAGIPPGYFSHTSEISMLVKQLTVPENVCAAMRENRQRFGSR